MLSVSTLTPGRADYYVDQVAHGADEYYTSGQAEPGRWLGSAAGRLSLSGAVTPDAFRAVLEGNGPDGEALGLSRSTAKRAGGFDLCLSAPKSVSIAWALGAPELAGRVATAHDRAVEAAVSAIEAEAVRARRGAGGRSVVSTEGVVAAAFAHRSSRAGDPQLHTHLVVANLTPHTDGHWSALDSRRLYRWAKPIGYLYQAALRHELSALGFGFGAVRNGMADIDGVGRDVIEAFSARRAEIEAEMARNGASSRAGAEVAALATRGTKASVPELGELRRRWHAQATALGLDEGQVASWTTRLREPPFEPGKLAGELLGPGGLTAHSSSFDRRAVLQGLAASQRSGMPGPALLAATDDLLSHEQVVALGPGSYAGGPLYSTTELVALEERLVSGALARLSPGPEPVTPGTQAALERRPSLSDEQRRMVVTLVGSASGVQVVVGRAGAGKTFALDAAREAWQADGRIVVGTALAARAAAELQAGSGIASATLDRLLADLERPGPLSGLAPGTVVVVDEAGMVETRKLARLLGQAERYGAKVVLVGDPRQLPEVGAGGAFGALAHRLPVVELRQNRRQAEAWERDALAQLRSGPVDKAVAAYEVAGRVVMAADAEGARRALVEAWWSSLSAGEDAMMYALRRADVDDLNRRARSCLEDAGLLGPARAELGPIELALGDRVMCLRNDRRLGVSNGTVGTVTSITDAGVALSEGVRLPAWYIEAGHLAHAYATTVHKAQGATVDRAFLLGSDQLYREAGYVGMSRARLSSQLFVVAPEGAEAREAGLDGLVEDLRRSRAQHLAIDQAGLAMAEAPVAAHGRKPGPAPTSGLGPGTAQDPSRAVAAARERALLADPPEWALHCFGEPPLSGPARRRWARDAGIVDAFRQAHGVDGPLPLGPEPPAGREARVQWELARLAISTHPRHHDLDRGLGR